MLTLIESWVARRPFVAFMVGIVAFAVVIDIGVAIAAWIHDRVRG